MTVNIGTSVATVKIVFSTSRTAALIQNLKVAVHNFYHRTIVRSRSPSFYIIKRPPCLSIHCADQQQLSNPDLIIYTDSITLQISVNLANEYMQA